MQARRRTTDETEPLSDRVQEELRELGKAKAAAGGVHLLAQADAVAKMKGKSKRQPRGSVGPMLPKSVEVPVAAELTRPIGQSAASHLRRAAAMPPSHPSPVRFKFLVTVLN